MGGEITEDTMAEAETVVTFEVTPEMLVDSEKASTERVSFEFAIRQAHRADLRSLLDLMKNCTYAGGMRKYQPFENCAEHIARTISRLVEEPNSLVLLAERPSDTTASVGIKPVGMLLATTLPMWSCPEVKIAYTLAIWVEHASRENGVASRLIEALVSWGQHLDCSHVLLTSRSDFKNNRKTELFFRKSGFKLDEKSFVKDLRIEKGNS